ncbi:Mobile element protein (plasmid) [Sinorhizobium sojae CCBAU 05684]|uniref:Mobile element protein n=1 Tax=Sinorhizobium sojae CCBAU 05684 TaxID=716928 RepID=A0A249PLP9_9HYPH|nr:Mobile element protein [Sinorhizobium sojae CCBAU 05684]
MAETFAPGAVVSEVARRFEVSTDRIYTLSKHGDRLDDCRVVI